MRRIRLDQLLLDRGIASSKSRAQALVLAGKVFTGEQRLDKPGHQVPETLEVEVRQRPEDAWVGRGALKLLAGLEAFTIDPAGMTAIDVGASTGGFTEVLLARGAVRVHAVDVGHGQLAWSLRNDPRVIVHERTNARYLTRAQIAEPVDLVVCDASFISLRQVLPAALALTAEEAACVALIKPQFEAGRGEIGKKGVVRDPDVRARVCAEIAQWLGGLAGWSVLGVEPSPITGPEGNVEFLIGARRRPTSGGDQPPAR